VTCTDPSCDPSGDDALVQGPAPDQGIMTVSPATLRRLELAAGDLASACLAAMDRQPWFHRLTADQRAAVLLVTQRGVANFVAWLDEPAETIRLTAEAFRAAPPDLARRLSLRQTVELVRIATDVFEQHLPPLAADEDERRVLVEGVLRFGRGAAFAAATAYAGAAEARGAWDARLEALVVDAVVRGPLPDGDPAAGGEDALVSRAAALGLDPTAPVRVVVGEVAGDPRHAYRGRLAAERLGELRRQEARTGRAVLAAVQGERLVMLVSEPGASAPDLARDHLTGDAGLGRLLDGFGPGPVVVGPTAASLPSAHASAREALAGLRAAPGWPDAPRPVAADDLLPERAIGGDPTAHRRLVDSVVTPLAAAGGELLRTLAAYLEGGGALEACARALYVHPNTVRYRLRRVGDITGYSPTEPRDAFVLRTALVVARLHDWGDPPNMRP
jgi:PucR C-terminal helix-turn-helix domain/GGDEF-like domain